MEPISLDTQTIPAVKVFPSNRQTGPDPVAELRRSAQEIVFDEQSMPKLDRDDLDLETAQALVWQ